VVTENFQVSVFPIIKIGGTTVRDADPLKTRIPVVILDRNSIQETVVNGFDNDRIPAYELAVSGPRSLTDLFTPNRVIQVTHETGDYGVWKELETPIYYRIDHADLIANGFFGETRRCALVLLDG
jgi:hypothetical protein